MRLRGLPRELNCGNVNLIPSKDCLYSNSFETCVSCDSTYLTYLRLDCTHVHCESCSVFYEVRADQLQIHCTVCHEPRFAKAESTSLTHVFMAKFECPCGKEGYLHQLSRHRRSCMQLFPEGESGLASESSSSSLTLNGISNSSTDLSPTKDVNKVPKPFEFVVKGYIAQELNRMKEDVLNITRVERHQSETTLQTLQDRVSWLESRVNVNSGIQTRLDNLERATESPRAVEALNERVETLARSLERINAQRQVERDNDSSNLEGQDELSNSVRLLGCCKFLWFNVRALLRRFNNRRVPTETDNQTTIIAGYPCKVHLQIADDSGTKMLVAYVAIDDEVLATPRWPMRRRFIVKIFNHRWTPEFQNYFQTSDPAARDYFKGPGSEGFGTFFGIDMCPVEELTAQNMYQKCSGMICVGIELDPI